jgi:hypothetical protein
MSSDLSPEMYFLVTGVPLLREGEVIPISLMEVIKIAQIELGKQMMQIVLLRKELDKYGYER